MKTFQEWLKDNDRLDEFFFKPKFHYVGRDCTYVMNPDAALRQFGQKHVDDCMRRHAELDKKQKAQKPYDMNDPQAVASVQAGLRNNADAAFRGQELQTPRLQAAHTDNEGPSLNEWLVLSGIK